MARTCVEAYKLLSALSILAALITYSHQHSARAGIEIVAPLNHRIQEAQEEISVDNVSRIEQLSVFDHDIITSLAWSPDGQTLAVADIEGLWLYRVSDLAAPVLLESRHDDLITSVAYNSDGSMMATGSRDTTVLLRDTRTHETITSFDEPDAMVLDLDFSSDDRYLVAGIQEEDQAVYVWELTSGTMISRFGATHAGVYDVDFATGSDTFVSASSMELYFLDVVTASLIDSYSFSGFVVVSPTFSPDGSTLAFVLRGLQTNPSNQHGEIQLWNTNDRTQRNSIEGDFAGLRGGWWGLDFGPDGSMLVTADGNDVLLWDVQQQEKIRTLQGHTEGVRGVAFQPTGHLIASFGLDNALRLWGLVDSSE